MFTYGEPTPTAGWAIKSKPSRIRRNLPEEVIGSGSNSKLSRPQVNLLEEAVGVRIASGTLPDQTNFPLGERPEK